MSKSSGGSAEQNVPPEWGQGIADYVMDWCELSLTKSRWIRRRGKTGTTALVVGLLAFSSVGLAQTDSADRGDAVDASTSPPQDSFVVKSLRPLGPYENLPMTAVVRLKEFKDDTIGFFPLLRAAANAGVSQGIDSPPEWGQGAAGYTERFVNDLAINGVHQAIAFGAGTLFHEDNRYFASGKTTAQGRVIHALLSPFETHHEDGRVSFGYSNVLGAVGAGFASRLWLPESQQGGGNIARSIGFSFLGEAGFNTFREFVPDLIRKLQKR
jgi:hypothetical protein